MIYYFHLLMKVFIIKEHYMIELKHINKIYNGFNALNDISLTIKDGEICGIIGQSGAGKSTLVRCINMLEPPTSGDVIVNGRNMVTLQKRTP